MSKIAGQLLWNRVRIDSLPNGSTSISTGLCQKSLAFGTDPNLAARVMVIPMSDTTKWATITHSEPYVSNGVVYVDFANSGGTLLDVNVLFWDPHSHIGPGMADDYGMIQR